MNMSFVRTVAARFAVFSALSFALAVTPAESQAQARGTIRGQVVDAVTMRPLSGAQVSVLGTGAGALANQSGQFLILNVTTGSQTVRVDLLGYGTSEQ